MSFEIKPTPEVDLNTPIQTAVNNLIDSAPGSLDTLNELAAALNDDANFASNVTNTLASLQNNINNLNIQRGVTSGNYANNTYINLVSIPVSSITTGVMAHLGAQQPSVPAAYVTEFYSAKVSDTVFTVATGGASGGNTISGLQWNSTVLNGNWILQVRASTTATVFTRYSWIIDIL